MPPPLSHAYLVGAFAAGAPAGLGRGDLEAHRDLVLMDSTGYLWRTWWWILTVGASTIARGQKKRARACILWYPRPPRRVDLPSKATSKGTRSSWPGPCSTADDHFCVSQNSGDKNRTYGTCNMQHAHKGTHTQHQSDDSTCIHFISNHIMVAPSPILSRQLFSRCHRRRRQRWRRGAASGRTTQPTPS